MRLKEQRLYDRFKRHFVGWWFERVENMMAVGRPDVDLLIPSTGLLVPIEFKAAEDYPKRAATRVLGDDGLSLDQRNWHMNFTQQGGRSFILAAVGQDVYLFDGRQYDRVNQFSKSELKEYSLETTFPRIKDYLQGL